MPDYDLPQISSPLPCCTALTLLHVPTGGTDTLYPQKHLQWPDSFIRRLAGYAPNLTIFALSFYVVLPSDIIEVVDCFDWKKFATSAIKPAFPALRMFTLHFRTEIGWEAEEYEEVEKALEPIFRDTQVPVSIEWGETFASTTCSSY